MEDQDILKKDREVVARAAAIGAAALPIFTLLLSAALPLFGQGFAYGATTTVYVYLHLPVGMFGLLGFVILAVLGAILFGSLAAFWRYVLKP